MAQVATAADPVADAQVADLVTPVADPTGVTAAVEDGGQAGAADEGAVPEAPKPLSLADVADDDLLAQLRERRNGDGLSLEDRLRKSERDRVESDRRREAGKVESVTRRTARFLEKHGLDPNDVDRNDIGELNALSYYSHLDALGDIGKAWVEATANEFGVIDRALITDALTKYQDDPRGIDDLASNVLHAVRETVRTKTLAESSLSDVPEGSKLRGDLMAEAHRLADAELNARGISAKNTESPPTAPIGTPGGNDDARFASMTTGEVSYLPPAERARWREWRAKQPDMKAS